jgi:hypothetical protein
MPFAPELEFLALCFERVLELLFKTQEGLTGRRKHAGREIRRGDDGEV